MSDTPDAEAEAVAPDIRGGMLCIILAEAIRMFESKAEFLENARDLNKHDPDEHLVLDGRA